MCRFCTNSLRSSRECRGPSGSQQPVSVCAVQEIRSILSNGFEEIRDIPFEQHHAHGDSRHAVRYLAIGAYAYAPSGFLECHPWPTKFDVDDMTAVGLNWPDRCNFLPCDVLRHQTMVEYSGLIDGEHDHFSACTTAETMHEKGNSG